MPEVVMTDLFGIQVFLGAFIAELPSLITPLEISTQVITIVATFVLIIVPRVILVIIAIAVLIISFHKMESVCNTVVQVCFTIQILLAVNRVPLIAKIVYQTIHAKFVCQALF